VLPTVMEAKVEMSLVRGWIAVFAPRAMRCVPVSEACSAIIRVEARVVGGFGAGGMVEARLDDICAGSCGDSRECSC